MYANLPIIVKKFACIFQAIQRILMQSLKLELIELYEDNIGACYKKKDEIVSELDKLFSNAKKS